MARKSARAAAVQMVFENMLGGDGGEETLRGLIEFAPEENDQEYIDSILAGVEENAETLDAAIEKCLKGWTLDRIAKVDRALESVGLLPEHKSRYPHEFSGGQRQRVGIARAMIMDPKFIVADEPISALDVSIRAQVLNLMNKLKAERNLTYLFIAHDLSVVRFIADRIAVIHLGEIVEIAESETLFKYPMHPYTVSLLSAVPMPDPLVEKNRKHIVYDPSQLDQSGEPREMRELRPGHFVFCTSNEFAGYEEKIKEMEQEKS